MLRIIQRLKLISQIPVLRDDLYLLDKDAIVEARFLLVHVFVLLLLIIKRNLRNLRKKLDRLNPRTARLDQIAENLLDQIGLEDVAEWNPREECLQRLQTLSYQARLDRLRRLNRLSDDEFTELEDSLKIIGEHLLQLGCLPLQERVFAEVEYLFTQQLQNVQRVLTFRLRLTGCLANVRNEILPRNKPLLFDNRNERDIQLRNQMLLRFLVLVL